MTPVQRAVVSCLAIVTAGQMPAFLTGALAVQVRAELDFTVTGLGLAISGFFVASAVASAAAGHVVERVGWRAGLRLGAATTAASLAGVALLAHSWPTLAGLLALAGLGNAISQPASNLALVRVAPGNRHGLVFGVKQSAILVATLLGGLSVPAIALTVGWRWTYVLAAFGGVIAAMAVPRIPGVPDAASAAPPTAGRGPLPGRAVRGLLLVAAAGACAAMVGNAFGAFLVSAAVEGGLQPGAAGLLLAAGSAAGLTVRITLGWLADRRPFHPLGAMATLLTLGSAGCMLLAAGPLPALVVGALLGVGAGWGWPGLYNLAVVREHPETAALATGITQTGVYVGAAAGPSAFGLLADSVGYGGGWLATTLLALVSAALAARGRRALHEQLGR